MWVTEHKEIYIPVTHLPPCDLLQALELVKGSINVYVKLFDDLIGCLMQQ